MAKRGRKEIRGRSGNSAPVYASGRGRLCPACARPVAECACRANPRPSPGDGVVRVSLETKGRKGKGVTLVQGVPLPPNELASLAAELKRRSGSGGTLKDGVIEIQGDRRDATVEFLESRGFTVRRAGG